MAASIPPPCVVEIQLVQFNETFGPVERYGIIHPDPGREMDAIEQWSRKCKGKLNSPHHRPSNFGSNFYSDIETWIYTILDWCIFLPEDYSDSSLKYGEFLADSDQFY